MNKKVDEEYKNIQDIYLLQCNCTELKEDLEYSNYCNEELRKKITNLEYKIKLLEEDNTGEITLYHSEREVKEELQDRIDKALNKLEEIALYDEYITIHTDFINDTKEILKGESNE